jgi:hypothetical protein
LFFEVKIKRYDEAFKLLEGKGTRDKCDKHEVQRNSRIRRSCGAFGLNRAQTIERENDRSPEHTPPGLSIS